jgi:hypothetical protein
MNSCTWHCFLFAAIHSEFLLLGTCLKDSVCVDENVIWCSLWFEVHTEVVMKSSSFWDATPFSPFKVNRHFGGTYCLHYHCRWISRQETSMKQAAKNNFLLGLLFNLGNRGQMVLRNFDWLWTDCTALYPRKLTSSMAYNDFKGEPNKTVQDDKINISIPPCLIMHYAIKVYGRVEV